MSIYIASKTKHADKWKELRSQGVPIISTWIDESGPNESNDLEDLWIRCIKEASNAYCLIAYMEPGDILKGAFIEIGAALASNIPVILVGFKDSGYSFINHPLCKCEDSLEKALNLFDDFCLE